MKIVLLVLDTARGDTIHELLESGNLPNLKSLAETGQYYSQAWANGPWTVPSHGSIFTGKYPSVSGISGADPTYDSVPLVDSLNQAGYLTGGFSANPWLSSEFNFDRSFNHFQNKFDYTMQGTSILELLGDNDGQIKFLRRYISKSSKNFSVTDLINLLYFTQIRLFRKDSGGNFLINKAIKWLNAKGYSNKFAFINITEPHLPYAVPSKWMAEGVKQGSEERIDQDPSNYNAGISTLSKTDFSTLQSTYRSTLRYTDYLIGKLIKSVRGETTFIITGDHGEHFGERSRFGHQYSLYPEVLHVPLVINGPNISPEVVSDRVELKELFTVIQDLAEGQEARLSPAQYHIAELIQSRPSLTTLKNKNGSEPLEHVVKYSKGAKSIYDGENRLIKTTYGGGGVEDISTQSIEDEKNKELMQVLNERCKESIKLSDGAIDVSSSTRSQLKDLGYM